MSDICSLCNKGYANPRAKTWALDERAKTLIKTEVILCIDCEIAVANQLGRGEFESANILIPYVYPTYKLAHKGGMN